MLSNFLIQDKFLDFDFDSVQEQKSHITNKVSHYLQSSNEYTNELIEEINDDENYNLYEQEIKYKIFENICSVSKKNNIIELVLDIPVDNTVISINKIKLSNKLNKYIKDIYVCTGDEKIITHKDFLNLASTNSKFTEHISNHKIINCQYNKNITLHVLLFNKVINKIIKKNIFVNYSFAIFKPKLKFI